MGTKTVQAVVQSASFMTHSCRTMQLLLVYPFLVLKEIKDGPAFYYPVLLRRINV